MTALAGAPPSPRPFRVGEHVLCTLTPSSPDPPVPGLVVDLDEAYKDAAEQFSRRRTSPSTSSRDNVFPSFRSHAFASINNSHTLLSSSSLSLASHHRIVDTDDERYPFNSTLAPTKILFREAHSKPERTPSPSPKSRPKKRRSHIIPDDRETSVDLQNPINHQFHSSPQPITIGRVYVHFSGRDRRLDRWASPVDVQRASPSTCGPATSNPVPNALFKSSKGADVQTTPAGQGHEPTLTRARRRAYEQVNPTSEKEVGNDAVARLEKDREEHTKVRNITTIVFGEYSIDAWYYSPFPLTRPVEVLHMCGKCLRYVLTSRRYVLHCTKCDWKDVPGFLMYEDKAKDLRVYEVSGVLNPGYCQRLCLLGKLFLDHKTLFFDTTPFLFYVITLGGEIAGFFSKEHPVICSEHNLSCIVTLPPHQKKGVGRFLISFSYELTKREGRTASPERPLSDLGQLSFRSYWAHAVTQYLVASRGECDKVPASTIAAATGILASDVVETLKSLQLVYMWRGETNADLSSRSLDAAIKKSSDPRLPFRQNFLKGPACFLKEDTVGCSNAKTPTPRKQQRSRDSAERIEISFSAPPKLETRSVPTSVEALKRRKRHTIGKFIRKHGSDRVLARLNTNEGLPAYLFDQLADDLEMSRKQARKNVLQESRRIAETQGTQKGSETKGSRELDRRLDTKKVLEEPSDSEYRSRARRNGRASEQRYDFLSNSDRLMTYNSYAFKMGDSESRKRHDAQHSPTATRKELSPVSDGEAVKFVESTLRSPEGLRPRRDGLRRSSMHSRDPDVVVIDS